MLACVRSRKTYSRETRFSSRRWLVAGENLDMARGGVCLTARKGSVGRPPEKFYTPMLMTSLNSFPVCRSGSSPADISSFYWESQWDEVEKFSGFGYI